MSGIPISIRVSASDINVLIPAVKSGIERQKVRPGSVTFIQRFSSAINVHVHYPVVCLEGVSLERTDQGLTPRLIKGELPPDAASADVVQTLSQ